MPVGRHKAVGRSPHRPSGFCYRLYVLYVDLLPLIAISLATQACWAMVLQVLDPIWREKRNQVRGRIEAVLNVWTPDRAYPADHPVVT